MLSFDSALSNALLRDGIQPLLVCKLFYNDDTVATNFIGVSDTDIEDGSDFYYGLVVRWPPQHHSADFFNFKTSITNGILVLSNVSIIEGGRFSDLLATKNFAGRKWEIFLNVDGLSTLDTAARMIGTGVISGELKYVGDHISIELLDFTSKYHKTIPVTKINSTNFPNSDKIPDINIDKPIPMIYGDFHDRDDVGTIPTTGAEFDRHFVKSHFPAPIVDSWDEINGYVEARCDNEALTALDTKNVYIENNGLFGACEDGNVTVDATASTPQITFKGTTWRVYISCISAGNLTDDDFNSFVTMAGGGGGVMDTENFSIPKIPKLGELTAINLLLALRSFVESVTYVAVWDVKDRNSASQVNLAWDPTPNDQTEDITSFFSAAKQASWDLEMQLQLRLQDTALGVGPVVSIDEIGIEIEFEPSQTFIKDFLLDEISFERRLWGKSRPNITKKVLYTDKFSTADVGEYIYFAGKGRKFFSAIDSGGRSNGFASGGADDPIQNPIYIIEDIIRTEMGRTEIDTTSFDNCGNTTDGFIEDAFDLDAKSIKFAFAQYKEIFSKDLIDTIARMCCSWVFISGDGNFKCQTRRKPADYSSADKSVDYNDIMVDEISQTPLNEVYNDIAINYRHNYGTEKNEAQETVSDATSQGSGISGYNEVQELVLEADFIWDSNTAGATANQGLVAAYLAFFKDRWIQIRFETELMRYADLEIADIVNFSNWPSDLKLFGSAMDENNDFFMVTEISKSLNRISIDVIQVSD